jgi:hypothetical protein
MAVHSLDKDSSRFVSMAVGALVLHFAMLEHWIDGMVATTFYHVDGARSIRTHYPIHAAAEIEFLRQCFQRLPALKRFKDRGPRFLDKLAPLAEMRHHVVHGHLRSIDYEKGLLEFSRVIQGKDNEPIRRTLTIHASELVAQSHDMHALIPIAMDLCHRLMAQFGPQKYIE